MNREKLTRDEAVAIAGEAVVAVVDRKNCEYSMSAPVLDEVEFCASVAFEDADGREWTLTAYYYQDAAAAAAVEELDQLDWTIAHYTIM